jgi:phenylalanyl-tRNA synthetase beta chain
MVGAGFYEVMDFDWLAGSDLAALQLPEGDPRLDPIRIRNPLNEEQEYLRTTLIPGLLDGLRRSASRNRPDAALFEIGSVYLRGPEDLPDQPRRLGFAATGDRPGSPLDPAQEYDATDAVGVIEVLSVALGSDLRVVQGQIAGLHPGRGAWVMADGEAAGFVGELDPQVGARWDLTERVIVAELDVAVLTSGDPAPFAATSPYPPVVFDLAFDLPEETPSGDLVDAVRAAAGTDLERVTVFDVFQGPPLDHGRKSIAVRLTLRNMERTLTDEEIEPVRLAVTDRVAAALGGSLRGGS